MTMGEAASPADMVGPSLKTLGRKSTILPGFLAKLIKLSIVATAALFLKHRKLAGLLMLPYLVWVSFASVLNFTIWRLTV